MQKIKKLARPIVFVSLALWTCLVSLFFAKPVLVHLNQNQLGKSENVMLNVADVFLTPFDGDVVKIDWSIAVNAPLIWLFPVLVAAFLLDIFILQEKPIKLGFIGVMLLGLLAIGIIDGFLWLVLGGWSAPAPVVVTLIVLLVTIPLGLWNEVAKTAEAKLYLD